VGKGLNQNEGRRSEITTMMKNKTIEGFIRIEPRLGRLRDEVLAIMSNGAGNYEARNRLWALDLKPRFEKLVGFQATEEALSSSEAYNIVYQDFVRILKI